MVGKREGNTKAAAAGLGSQCTCARLMWPLRALPPPPLLLLPLLLAPASCARAATAQPSHVLFFVIDVRAFLQFYLCRSLRAALAALLAFSHRDKTVAFAPTQDYGFGDASYKNAMYPGQTHAPPTPTIDRLAMDGVRLESYYVNKLCSATRTSLLSGRYAYTNGMDNTVIVDGDNQDLPLNLLTVGDYLQRLGWNTSAYGKWDAGMTAWGSTPTCRGFDHFRGYYNAAEDYYTHMVGPGFDYHIDERGNDKGGDVELFEQGTYSTLVTTGAVQDWVTGQLAARRSAKTFAYVAHQAVHGPLEVPAHYITGECEALIPASYPVRRIYCGMVRAVDESVRNITATYETLGILNETLIVLTTDNGGTTDDGGNNYPLR